MVSWVVGDEYRPLDVFEIAKASTMTELRQWACERVCSDPGMDEAALSIFLDHSTWEGTWPASEVPKLLEALVVLRDLAITEGTEDNAWRQVVLSHCIEAARKARDLNEGILVR